MGSFGVSVKRALSVCASSAMLLSGMASGLDKYMIEKCTSSCVNFVPSGVDGVLSRHFACFNLGEGVKMMGNIPPSILEAKANVSGFAYYQIDINSMSLDSMSAVLESNKGKKLVLCLTNLDCTSESKFREFLKLLGDNVFLYIYGAPCCYCSFGGPKCKDCINLNYDLKKFEFVDKIFYPGRFGGLLYVDAKEMVENGVKSWKNLKDKKEIDVEIDLDDEDIKVMSGILMGGNADWIKNFVKHAFILSSMRNRTNPKLCLADFIKVCMDTMVSSVNLKIADEDELSVAVHEVGHALIGYLNGISPLVVVTREKLDGVTLLLNENASKVDGLISSYDEILAIAKMGLAGKVAGKVICGEDSGGAWSDLFKVSSLLREAVMIRNPMLVDTTAEVDSLYREIYAEVEKMITENSELIRRLAKRLMSKGQVNGLKMIKGSDFVRSIEEIKVKLEEEGVLMSRLSEFMKNNELTEDFVKYVEEYGKDNEKDKNKDKGKEKDDGSFPLAPAPAPVVDKDKTVDVKKVIVKTYSNEPTKKDETPGKKDVTSIAKVK